MQDARLERERSGLLYQLERAMEIPMIVLAFAWLVLVGFDLLGRAHPAFGGASTAIWIVFLLDFTVKLVVAPRRLRFVRRNWLTVVSLVLPALRVARVARALRLFRLTRGVRLVRLVGSLNRGLRSLRRMLRRRAAGYAAAATVVVTLSGAAGMMAFERGGASGDAFGTYAASLWWTAMMMTTMGTGTWPATPEGRTLCLLLAVYAFAAFGYLTATLASFFVWRDAEEAARRPAPGAARGL